MTNILYISVSPRAGESASRKVGEAVINRLKQSNPMTNVVNRDLHVNPVPHMDGHVLMAVNTPKDKQSKEDQGLSALSDTLVQELLAADTIVIATPMWNFSVPSGLKAWIDHIVRAGVTFAYTDKGPKGLITGKKLIIVVSTGGIYSEGPASAFDFSAPYLKSVFAFLGITDSTIIRAEGTNDPVHKDTAIPKALTQVDVVLA